MRRTLTWLIASGLLGVPLAAGADNPADIEAEAALEVDTLLVLDLPLVAHEARTSGIAKEDVELALSSARDGGLSAADANEIVTAEVEATRKEGKARESFGQWVRQQVAAGTKGVELAQAIRERRAELKATAQVDSDIDAKLAKLREERKALRAKLQEKQKELLAAGQKLVVRGKTENAARQQALLNARAELLEASKELRARPRSGGKDIDARAAAQAKIEAKRPEGAGKRPEGASKGPEGASKGPEGASKGPEGAGKPPEHAATPGGHPPDGAARVGEAKRAEIAEKKAAERRDVNAKPDSAGVPSTKTPTPSELKPSTNQATTKDN